MIWKRIAIHVAQADIESACARLSMAGYDQLEIVDDVEAIKAHLEATAPFWDYAEPGDMLKNGGQPLVRLYVPDDGGLDGVLGDINAALDNPRVTVDDVRDDDWVESYKKNFTAIPVGERLMVRPDWDEEAYEGRTVVTLTPGLVFGTGDHQSTQLCLEGVERHVARGHAVLDLGCGSGILSIAALLLGADRAVAVDVDPAALKAARENADMNGIAPGKMPILIGDAVKDMRLRDAIGGGYDVVLINIVADVIIALLPFAAQAMKRSGIIIVSGIIRDRAADVERAAAACGLRAANMRAKDEWVCMDISYV